MKYYFYLFYISYEGGLQGVLTLRTLVKAVAVITKERWCEYPIFPDFKHMIFVVGEEEAIKKSKYKNCCYATEEEMKMIFAEHKLRIT
jgi:hypothetical protein